VSPVEADTSQTSFVQAGPAETAKHEKHYWRNLFELAAVVAGGTTWYWVNEERQVADWDFPSWEQKLTFADEVLIFDNNFFQVNYAWHTYAGGSSHLLGRSNNLTITESFAFGTLASLFWEYGIEAREKISVNDILMTNTTGIPTGEYFHRVAQYVNQGQKGWAWDVARWTVGLGHTAHARLDKLEVAQDRHLVPTFRWYYSVDSMDFSRQDGSDASTESDSAVMHNIGFDGTMVAYDDYLQTGHRQGWFNQANFSDFSLQFGRGDGSSTRAEANTLLAGWHTETIPEKGLGSALSLGTSIGYLYHREQTGLWQDKLGGLHAPGLAAEGLLLGEGWQLHGEARANYDLVGVNSLSWQQFRRERPDDIGKQILKSSGYYYGHGPSVRLDAELQVSRFELGGKFYYGSYNSIEGFERNEMNVPDDMQAIGSDSVLDLEVFLRGQVYEDIYTQLRFGRYYREGTLDEFSANEDLTRLNFEIGLAY
jgi:hypothetical protein